MFAEFRKSVLMLLDMAVKHGRYDIPVAQVLHGLIAHTNLFEKYDEEDKYRRAYRYAIQLRQALVRVGWDLKDINGRKHFSLICPAAREKDYTKCDGCDKRVECLLDPLHQ